MNYSNKVDFHAHYLSKTYYEYLEKYEGPRPDGFPTPDWSPEAHLKLNEKLGVAFSFLSVSSPNLSKADLETEIRMVHRINQEGKAIIEKYPDHFGLFASLPLPNVDASLKEAAYALDNLKADGFGLSTHYAGLYLGSPAYDPLMEFLDSRGAVVAVHPVTPAAVPDGANETVPIPAMEFFMDTTRTFTNMVMHDIFGRYPRIQWIFPHAGAFLPILSDRMMGFAIQMRSNVDAQNTGNYPIPLDFKADMRHVCFDAAGFPLQKQLSALLKDVSPRNLVYGSDTPYTPDIACIALSGGLEQFGDLSEKEKQALFTGNAIRMIPRLGPLLSASGEQSSPKDNGSGVSYAQRPLTGKEKRSRRLRLLIAKGYGRIFG